LKKILIFPVFLFLVGCGYKPSSTYTKPILGDTITTKVDIDIKNPTDSIYLKDALNEAVVGVFNAKVDCNGSSTIKLKVSSTSLSVLDYDKNGYPILYRANASIKAYVTDVNNSLNTYTGNGSYDFSINANSVISDSLRENAIKEAFLKALQEIEFKLAVKGIKDDNKRSK